MHEVAPVDKIAVKEIVEGYGVIFQRTFYRNFLDKYDPDIN